MNGPTSSTAIKDICDYKDLSREFISRANLQVPKSKTVRVSDDQALIEFCNTAGYPVVLKPINMARGSGVITNIKNESELLKAQRQLINIINSKYKDILIETQFDGNDYRAVVVDNKIVSVYKRKRANVTGDGFSTIEKLINKKNTIRKQNIYLKDKLIPLDINKLDKLKEQGYSLNTIPAKNELVILRSQSNISGGGDNIDATDKCHPKFIEIILKTAKSVPGISYCGIDIITKDISKQPTTNNYIVTEIEFSPGPGAMFPINGASIN